MVATPYLTLPTNYRSLLQNVVSFVVSFTKETYNFKKPTNRSHPIAYTATHKACE